MGNFLSQIQEAKPESNQDENVPQSAWGMLLTLAPTLVTFLIFIVIFLILRKSQRRYYAPRTYLGSLREWERSPELPTGMFNWIGAFWKIPDSEALRQQSLDAYLFMRFLRVCMTVTFVGACITWPILFPVNATGGGGQSQLEILSYSNIDVNASSGRDRLYAHALVAWVFYSFVMYMIFRECVFYINLRQAFLLTPQNANRISSRTVLFTSVPTPYLDEHRLRKLFSDSVKHVWITYDSEKVDDLVKERNKVAMKLEKAEIKLLKLVNKERNASIKKSGGDAAAKHPPPTDADSNANAGTAAAAAEAGYGSSVADKWLPRNKRPSHRLGLFGLMGKKVDTIDWCRAELERLIPETEKTQAEYRAGAFPKIPAVFIEFYTQSDAQAAYQVVTHHQALHMTPKFVGVQPGEVVWKSLRISWLQKIIRTYAVWAFIVVLIIFWAIPVAVVGIISQVSTLTTVPGLTWLAQLPAQVLGLIGGILPPVALSILLSLVPVIMRLCARLTGEVSESNVELFCQKAYFIFQLVQVFLVRTIGDTASTLVVKVSQDPNAIFDVLSKSIPTSSNFYISYFMVEGFTIAASTIAQIAGFVIFTLLYKFFSSTPRAMYRKWTSLSALMWGSLLPIYTNIAVISVTYAIIAPIMLFWATVAMGLFYLAYRYNILFVTDTRVDTHGLIYPRALKQLFSGVYIAEICMIGMFAVSRAYGPLVLMVIFLIFTIVAHSSMQSAIDPLLYNLPRNLLIEEESIHADLTPTVGVDPGHAQAQAQAQNSSLPVSRDGAMTESNDTAKTAKTASTGKTAGGLGTAGSAAASGLKPVNRIAKWLKPWLHADYPTQRALVHENPEVSRYAEQVEEEAYFPPTVTDAAPMLWIPADLAGVSKDEVAQTSRVIAITDEGCSLDENNKLVWDSEGARPPIWDEKVYY